MSDKTSMKLKAMLGPESKSLGDTRGARLRLLGKRSMHKSSGLEDYWLKLHAMHSESRENTLERTFRDGLRQILKVQSEGGLTPEESEQLISLLVSLYSGAKINMEVNEKFSSLLRNILVRSGDLPDERRTG